MDLKRMVSELLAEYETPGVAIGLVDGAERTIVAAGSRGMAAGPLRRTRSSLLPRSPSLCSRQA
jgi:hypothetical protein